jgi:hypothetical protein
MFGQPVAAAQVGQFDGVPSPLIAQMKQIGEEINDFGFVGWPNDWRMTAGGDGGFVGRNGLYGGGGALAVCSGLNLWNIKVKTVRYKLRLLSKCPLTPNRSVGIRQSFASNGVLWGGVHSFTHPITVAVRKDRTVSDA